EKNSSILLTLITLTSSAQLTGGKKTLKINQSSSSITFQR
ncbi:MAG: hypothetical protein ACJAR8_002068, partial [Bacteroidia bacterium]